MAPLAIIPTKTPDVVQSFSPLLCTIDHRFAAKRHIDQPNAGKLGAIMLDVLALAAI
jgi:hypothetical protein